MDSLTAACGNREQKLSSQFKEQRFPFCDADFCHCGSFERFRTKAHINRKCSQPARIQELALQEGVMKWKYLKEPQEKPPAVCFHSQIHQIALDNAPNPSVIALVPL